MIISESLYHHPKIFSKFIPRFILYNDFEKGGMPMKRKTIAVLLIILTVFGVVFAEFGPPSDKEIVTFTQPESSETEGLDFVSSSEDKGFGPASGTNLTNRVETVKNDFWFHDIFLKIITVAALIIASLLIFLFFRNKRWYRKLLMVSSVIIIGFIFGGFLCPVTAVQNVIIKFGTAYTILFSIPLISTLLFGRIYCSSVCPYGALSELLHIRKFAIRVPKKLDKILKYVKYGILIFLVLRIFLTGELIGDTPFKALFTFGGETLNWIMTGVFLFLSLFIYRPFCRYFCPYGALMALISKISLFRLKKDEKCVSCRICEKTCQMDAMDEQAKANSECILCGECCQKCPKDSLSLSTNKKR